MARLVAAYGSSHSPMLNSAPAEWLRYVELDKVRSFTVEPGTDLPYDALPATAQKEDALLASPRDIERRHQAALHAMDTLRTLVHRDSLDVLLIVGDDQEEMFDLSNMPALAIYYGASIDNYVKPVTHAANWPAWFQEIVDRYLEETAPATYLCEPSLARHLIGRLIGGEFDVSGIEKQSGRSVGHAFSFIHKAYVGNKPIKILPIFINTYYAPNQPTPARCISLGKALVDALDAFPGDMRVGIMASGGLSHFYVDDALDRRIIEALKVSDLAALTQIDTRLLEQGSSEIRNWMCVAGAVASAGLQFRWSEYVPGYRTPAKTGTGLCFTHWN
jgi:3-O-methylgallate 3,4-dioxygenase